MNYEASWKMMADLITELRKNGETIPSSVMKDLRSAKTMIQILKADKSNSENILKVEEYLGNLESSLIPTAKKRLGSEYVDEWISQMLRTQMSDAELDGELRERFPLGVPRDKRWVRIQPSEDIPWGKINQLAEELGLAYRSEQGGRVLVYGEEDRIREFVKKMTDLFRKDQG